MNTRLDPDAKAITLMVGLCAIWGMQQVVLKATAADIAPIMQIGLRSGVAALLVGLVMWRRKEPMDLRDGTLRPGGVVALLFGLEFLLVAEGLRHTTASHMVVFLYTAPMFAALGLHWKLPAERLGILLAGACLTGQARFNPTPQVWASLAFHSLVVSFASFLAWFWLLRHYLASRLGVFSFLTPLFGIVFGAWLLSEPIEASFLLGAVPVLIGIVLVSGGGWVTQQWAGRVKTL